MSYEMTDDSKTIFLLCAQMGDPPLKKALSPLTASEYSDLALWLDARGKRPDDLYDGKLLGEIQASDPERFPVGRLATLLDRAPSLMLTLEKWINRNIWIVTRSDEDYPRILKRKLRKSAPPFLYGTGERELIGRSGLGVVGSRDADPEGLEFARFVGERCAKEGLIIISGGARGVDRAAMLGCMENDGYSVGILPHGLARFSMTAPFRDYLIGERLLLLSPYSPDSEFSSGAALGRNRYIYLLSQGTLAVSSDISGGTWSGATENLKKQWVPLWVREGENVPAGNRELIRMGGIPLTQENLESRPILNIIRDPKSADSPKANSQTVAATRELDIYPLALPRIEEALEDGATVIEMAERLGIVEEQARAWLERGINEGQFRRCGKGRFRPSHPDEEKGTPPPEGPRQILMFPA